MTAVLVVLAFCAGTALGGTLARCQARIDIRAIVREADIAWHTSRGYWPRARARLLRVAAGPVWDREDRP